MNALAFAKAVVNRGAYTPPTLKPRLKPPPSLLIGKTLDGELVRLPLKERFRSHLHVLGSSGFGKSFFLYFLICQDIMAGRGICLIDPHGELFRMVLNFCLLQKIDPSRLVVIDPVRTDVTTYLDPLQYAGANLAVESLIRTAGERDLKDTPLVGKYLPSMCKAFEEAGEPLATMADFAECDGAGSLLRQRILSRVKSHRVIRLWQQFELMSPRDRRIDMSSSLNRVIPFIEDPRIERMFSSSKNNLDWFGAVENSRIILIHLGCQGGPPLPERSKDLIGTLALLSLREAAFRRQVNPNPFCVYVDEVGRFITDDYADALDELRKFGMFMTLSHQRTAQLETVSENALSAVLANCKTRIVFGGLGRQDAELMAKELFTGQIDGETVKYESVTISFKPVTVWEEIRTESAGAASGESYGSGKSNASMSGHGAVMGVHGLELLGMGLPFTGPPTLTTSESGSDSNSSSEMYSYSTSQFQGVAITRVPVTYGEAFEQEASKTFYQLEEEWEKVVALLMNMPVQGIAFKTHGQRVVLAETIEIDAKELAFGDIERYARLCWDACPSCVPSSVAGAAFDTLRTSLGLGTPNQATLPDEPAPRKRGRPRKELPEQLVEEPKPEVEEDDLM